MDKGRRTRAQGAFESSTPLPEIAKKMKRTERALRRKAGILGIGLGHHRSDSPPALTGNEPVSSGRASTAAIQRP